MDLTPVTLAGQRVRLEPLRLDHVAELWAVGADERFWRYTSVRITSLDEMRAYVEAALVWQAAGTCMPWVTRLIETGRIVGSTRFANIVQQHRVLEIGCTWPAPAVQRTGINIGQSCCR